jgi:transposase-like protein
MAMNQAGHCLQKGANCPVCGSNYIEGNFVETGGGVARQGMICLDCGATWVDQYALTGYTGLVEPSAQLDEA